MDQGNNLPDGYFKCNYLDCPYEFTHPCYDGCVDKSFCEDHKMHELHVICPPAATTVKKRSSSPFDIKDVGYFVLICIFVD